MKGPHDATIRRAVRLPDALKSRLRSAAPTRALWSAFRARQVESEYRARREHYHGAAETMGLRYSEDWTTSSVRRRLAARGYTPRHRQYGDVHTFAMFPLLGWHEHLLPDLRELGPVTHFDYHSLGFRYEELAQPDARAAARREELFRLILPAVRAAHAQRAIDWIFCYGGGQDLSPDVLRAITEELGVPIVNMSLDDKQGWAGRSSSRWRTGAVDITAHVDLYMTSARVACEWHMVEGGRPLYLPEGFDAVGFAPRPVARDLPASFVGAAYGFRLSVVDYLRRHGIDVRTFGSGWPRGGWVEDSVDVFNRSIMNLGMGGIEYSEELTNLKGRDFEIPGTGGGAYLTSFNPDLAQHFAIGEEILCYRGRDEMLELMRHYLGHPEDAEVIAARGRARAMREHRWLHRYEAMLRILGVLEA
jgi:hypothetical protein